MSSSATTEPVFPQLRILSLSHMAALQTSSRAADADEAVAVLVGWLQREPHFRLLRVDNGLTVEHAVTLSSLPQLRGLAASWCSDCLQGDIGRFFRPYKGWSTVRLFQQHWMRWNAAAESDEDMEDAATNIPRFVTHVDGDGRSGREAFFEWLSGLPPQWEAEEMQRRWREEALMFALRD